VAHGDYDAVLRDADSVGLDAVLSRRPLVDLVALADASRYRARTDVAQRTLTAERSRFPRSKEAHTAAFLLGRLADDQTHDAAAAIAWYDRYLGEAPTGPFASDALGRKMIAVQRTKGPDAARPIAEQYARRFPHGAYAAQAEELRTR
jgi:TolA-binding protein